MKQHNVTLKVEEKSFTNKKGELVTFIEYTILDVNGLDIKVTAKDDTGKQVLATLLNK